MTITITLAKGYNDEFTFDFGWTVSGTATTGAWERGIPNGSNSGSAPSFDADFDCDTFFTPLDMKEWMGMEEFQRRGSVTSAPSGEVIT